MNGIFCPVCGPGYRFGDEGCNHAAPDSTPTEREAGDVGEVAAVLAAAMEGHREDATYPDTCVCETEIPDYLDNHFAAHIAEVQAAALAPLVAERERAASARALWDAADDWDYASDTAPRWLRERADRIGGE